MPQRFRRTVGGEARVAQGADEERGQVQRGLGGPVQVLHDQHDRAPGAEPAQGTEDVLKELGLLHFLGGRADHGDGVRASSGSSRRA